MHSLPSMRLVRILMFILSATLLAACGEGDGQQRILGTPAPPVVAPPANCSVGIGFEDACPAVTFTDFEGGVGSIVDNPDQSGLNPSAKVGRMQKFGATSGLTFGGTTIGLPASLNVTAGSSFTMKVWSQRPVQVLFQPEPQGPGSGIEVAHGGSGWEELTFSLPGLSGAVSGITLIFDNGTLGAAATDPNNWTFYFDDITLIPPGTGGGGGGTFSAITFDDAGTTYTLTGFGGAEDSSVQPDPAGGTNQVVRVNRAAGAEVFAGTTVSTGANNTVPAIPLDASNTQMTVRVYSPAAGVPVRLKIEDAADPTISVETEATTTAANTWETLTFDFANEVSGTAAFNPAATYNRITIFFNFGAAGAPAETYFFDDIDVGSGGGGGGGGTFSAITFDDAGTTYTLTGFGGAEDSTVAADPAGGSNMVGRVVKSATAQLWAGTTVSTGANESIPTIPLDAANTQMTVRVYSPVAGIPIRLKIEDAADPTITVETEATTTGVNTWETLTFDFANEAAGTAAFNPAATYNKVSIFFNFGTDGASGGGGTFFFDDIDVVTGGGTGGGAFNGLSFDDAGTTYTLTGFGGAEDSSLTTDPTGGTNMVVRVNRAAGAQIFAGTTISTGANASVPPIPLDAQNTQMSVRVYSPAAGIPVRLKIEDSTNPAVSVEAEVLTTVANTWETLTFNFLNNVPGTAAFDPSATYDKITIFFNFGAAGAPAETYYFDDILVVAGNGGGGGGSTSFSTITFDDTGTTYTLIGFGGAEGSFVTNDPAGGTNMVVQVDRAAGAQVFAGTTVATEANDAVPTIPLDAGNTQMTVRVYSAAAGIPVRLKIENASDPTTSVETEATTTMAGAWETLTFNFLNEVPSTAAFNPAATYNKVTIFFNFGAAGAPAETYYFDDIDVLAGTGGSGGGGGTFAAITFDDAGTTYTLTGFGGAEDSTVAADPAGGSNMVGRVVKSATAQLWAGTTISTGANESIPTIPLDASNTQMNVRVYSPVAGIPIRLKIEDASDPTITVETEAVTTVANSWETLTFDFANEAAGTAAFNPAATYNKVSIFFNFGTDGASGGGGTFYFDDIDVGAGSGSGGGGGGFAAITFDDAGTTYTLTGFGGAEDSTVAADPAGGSNMVGRVVKSATAQLWAGTTVSTGANESIPTIPLDAANTQMTVRVYSPVAGIPIRLKIEDAADPTITVETEAMTTGVNTWETLTFDFANEAAGTAAFNPAATYNKVSIFFNFGTDGASGGGGTFFFDDIDVVTGGGTGGTTFSGLSFDDPGTTYTFTGFGGAEDTSLTTDPTGGSNMVVRVNRAAGAQTFAGSTISTGPNNSVPPIPLDASNTQMSVRVYSPAAGIPVRLKIEDSTNPAVSVEAEVLTTVANTWETLTFNFLNNVPGTAAFDPAATYDKVTIFFNFGAAGAPAETYYFDDLLLVAGNGGGGGGGGSTFTAITFDDAGTTYTLTDFGGNASTVTNDPAGGTNMVVQVVKSNTAQLWAGTTVSTEANDAVPVIPLDASNTQMTVRVYSPDAGIPVRLKIEDASDPTITVETEAMTTGVNTWETLTFDFANQAAGTAAFNPAATYNKVSIFFNFGTDGATAGEKTYYFDDIDVVTGGGAGGGGYAAISFDDAGTTYTLTGFGGAEDSTVAADPAGGSNMVGRVVKSATAQLWAGTTVSTGANESIPTLPLDASNTQMTVRVYSPVAGIPIRLKIEDATNPAVSVETEALTTGVNTWETLTFDFANEAAGTAAFDPAATYNKVSIFFNFGTDGASGGGGTFYFDDIDVGAGSGGGGGGSSNFVNGDFETGDFTGWTLFQDPPGGGSIAIDSSGQGGRTGSVARLVAAGSDVVGTNDVIIGQVALAAGTISPGDTIDVSFDLYGSLTGAGGVVFVEVIFLDGSGNDNGRDFVGPAAPYTPTGTWTTHMGTVTAGTTVGGGSADVTGGVTLELKAACGAIVGGCGVDASFDNVTFTIN